MPTTETANLRSRARGQTRPFDAWAALPAGFGFRGLERAAAALGPAEVVVDPFVGSGRGATFLAARGQSVIGIDAHPLMSRLSQLKLTRPGEAGELAESIEAWLAQRPRRSGRVAESDTPFPSRLVQLRDSVDPASPWAEHLRWALLGTLREAFGSGWPYRRARARDLDAREIEESLRRRGAGMSHDLAAAPQAPRATIFEADARREETWAGIEPGSVDGCLSSPPYLNQVSYAESTRMELQFLGLAKSWKEMYRSSGPLLASCTQQMTRARTDAAHQALADSPGLRALLVVHTEQLLVEQGKRKRPKRYEQLIWAYFAELSSVLGHLFRALRPGAKVAWVIGDSAPYSVYLDTPALTAVAASEAGFQLLEDSLLRRRGRRWPGAGGTRHRRELTERLIVFRRPRISQQLPLFN